VYPSPQAPLWAVIASGLRAERVLEIGCGLGYTAVCLADAIPDVVVHTIEQEPAHADLAEEEFRRLGLDQRITVLRESAEDILSGLHEPYDVVLEDAGIEYDVWLPRLTALTRRGGLLVTTSLSSYLPAWKDSLPTEAMTLVRAGAGS
jgi:predicted O-methyltransferase YrrM